MRYSGTPRRDISLEVEKEAFRSGRIVRDTLTNSQIVWPGYWCQKDQKKIHAVITKELRQVLEILPFDKPVITSDRCLASDWTDEFKSY